MPDKDTTTRKQSRSYDSKRGVDKNIVGENIIHELQDDQGLLFGTHFGKVQIPKNTAVIGTKILTNPRDLRVIEFYDEIPSMHNDSGYMDNRGNPVNYIARSIKSATGKQDPEKRIFNLDQMDPTPSHRNPASSKSTFQFYNKSPVILPAGASAEIEVVHDCTNKPSPGYQKCSRNPGFL